MGEEALFSTREVIHVAVGTNFVKEVPNLMWVMKKFPGAEVVLIHVHVLSNSIPMMGTKILLSIASEYAIKRHRKEERDRMAELMKNYISFCEQKKMQVKAAVIKSKDVCLGLQLLVQKLQIERLVHGSRSISKQKALLSYCQQWLVRDGKLMTKSEAAIFSHNTNPEEEEVGQYWSAMSFLLDSEDRLQLLTPPNDLEDQSVNNMEETRPMTPWHLRFPSIDAMNVESSKQQLNERDLAKLRRQNMQAKEELSLAFKKIDILEQQLKVTRQEKCEAMKENLALKASLQCTKFSASELEMATNNFHVSQKIGEGGYGPVYRGVIRHTPVAIKVLKPESRQGPSEFQQEVLILSMIRHPNVVILHGVCSETSALVYEHLANGNLDERLSGGKKAPPLSCWDRFRIINEQRSVLLLLHSMAIVHADLKLQNILLDANDISKLGDFGTARLILRSGAEEDEDGMFCCITNPMGTFGYMDPIFLTDGRLTPKSDIYSFGIIIMMLLLGSSDPRIRERVEEGVTTGTVWQLLDDSAGQWPLEQTEKLMLLAYNCCSFERSSRPSLLSEDWEVLETLMAIEGTK